MSVDCEKKTTKPSSLNLKVDLNDDLKSTMEITKQIQKQQRTLIAARIADSGSPEDSSSKSDIAVENGDSDESLDVKNDAKDGSIDKPTPGDESEPVGSSPTKRLKRSNIPPPLNIGLINSTNGNARAINSAPIRQSKQFGYQSRRRMPFPPASTTLMYPNGMQQQQPNLPVYAFDGAQQVPYQQFYPQVYRPFPNAQVSQVQPFMLGGQILTQQPLYRRSRNVLPHTSVGPYFPKNHRAPLSTTAYKQPVTDVYHGDYTKNAPLQSQPLSAQREAFNRKLDRDDDDAPVTDEEIREMQAKYDRGNRELSSVNLIRQGEIFGSINLMDEAVFKFRIFKQNDKDDEPTEHSNDTDDEDAENDMSLDKPRDGSRSTDGGANNRTETVSPQENDDDLAWLAKEKAKFLKICETSWDAFIDSKKSQ
jgi:down-regulator of invasive growth 2